MAAVSASATGSTDSLSSRMPEVMSRPQLLSSDCARGILESSMASLVIEPKKPLSSMASQPHAMSPLLCKMDALRHKAFGTHTPKTCYQRCCIAECRDRDWSRKLIECYAKIGEISQSLSLVAHLEALLPQQEYEKHLDRVEDVILLAKACAVASKDVQAQHLLRQAGDTLNQLFQALKLDVAEDTQPLVFTYIKLAVAQARIEDTCQARKSLNRAIRLFSNHPYCFSANSRLMILVRLAQACLECGFQEETDMFIHHIENQLRFFSYRDLIFDSDLVIILSTLYEQKGDVTKAQQWLGLITSQDLRGGPWLPWDTYWKYAYAQQRLQDTQGAKDNLKRALNNFGGFAYEFEGLARSCIELGAFHLIEPKIQQKLTEEQQQQYSVTTHEEMQYSVLLAEGYLQVGHREQSLNLLRPLLEALYTDSPWYSKYSADIVSLLLRMGCVLDAGLVLVHIHDRDTKLRALDVILRFVEQHAQGIAWTDDPVFATQTALIQSIKERIASCPALQHEEHQEQNFLLMQHVCLALQPKREEETQERFILEKQVVVTRAQEAILQAMQDTIKSVRIFYACEESVLETLYRHGRKESVFDMVDKLRGDPNEASYNYVGSPFPTLARLTQTLLNQTRDLNERFQTLPFREVDSTQAPVIRPPALDN